MPYLLESLFIIGNNPCFKKVSLSFVLSFTRFSFFAFLFLLYKLFSNIFRLSAVYVLFVLHQYLFYFSRFFCVTYSTVVRFNTIILLKYWTRNCLTYCSFTHLQTSTMYYIVAHFPSLIFHTGLTTNFSPYHLFFDVAIVLVLFHLPAIVKKSLWWLIK